MKIEALVASPRRNGNSMLLTEKLLTGLDSGKISGGITFLYDENPGPCTDCRACKRGDLVCTVEDTMQTIYPKLEAADVIVFATPIYWYGPSATMKMVIERLRPYYLSKRISGKKAVIILPAGNGIDDCDLTIKMFQRMFKELGLEILGIVTPKAFNPGDALKDENALTHIDKLADQINKLAAA